MPIQPKHSFDSLRQRAARRFTDREPFIQAFRAACERSPENDYTVLVYYGVGGIGKSTLRKKLTELLEEGTPPPVWSMLDFDIPSFSDEETALFALRKSLADKYKIAFHSFDLAYAVYWEKTRPSTPLNQDNFPLLEDGNIVGEILGTLNVIPIVGLIPKVGQLALRGASIFRDWWVRRGQKELQDLPDMEPKEIAEVLPTLWAADLMDFLDKHKRRAIFFLDTYEALGGKGTSEVREFRRDEWIRELVALLPHVLWVVCGRERLRWEELDSDWAAVLDQHLIGRLADEDADSFLTHAGVDLAETRAAIVLASKGVPYYLDLAVDTYSEIRARFDREPVEKDFGGLQTSLQERFLRYLDLSEVETLKLLSIPRFWDRELFEKLVTEFHTGYPPTAHEKLARFSFINEGQLPGTWSMQDLMEEELRAMLPSELQTRLHGLLYRHYAEQLVGLTVKSITPKHRAAFVEGVYHGYKALQPVPLANWFNETSRHFMEAYDWALWLPLGEEMMAWLTQYEIDDPIMARLCQKLADAYFYANRYPEAEEHYRKALELAESHYGSEHLEVANAATSLAFLYHGLGKYALAEPLFLRGVAILEKVQGADSEDVAVTLNELASMYIHQNRMREAEVLFSRSLELLDRIGTKDTMTRATILNNLAIFYRSQGRFHDAEKLYRQLIPIFQNHLGSDHPEVAVTLGNLGNLYSNEGRYAEAESLFQQDLAMTERALGLENRRIALTLNNYAKLCHWNGRWDEADAKLTRAIDILLRIHGPEHPNTCILLFNRAALRFDQGRVAEAETILRQLIPVVERLHGTEAVSLAPGLRLLGLVLLASGQLAEAESLTRRAWSIWERNRPVTNEGALRFLIALLQVAVKRDDADAIRNWLGFIEDCTQSAPTVAYAERQRNLKELKAIYERLGLLEQAASVSERLAQLKQ